MRIENPSRARFLGRAPRHFPDDPELSPILIVHGTDDRIVSYNFAERLVARAKETGVDYDLRALRDEGHSPWEHMYQYITWVHDFLDRRL